MSSKNIPTLRSYKAKVGITLGDPSGIGPEITLKAIARLKGLADFMVIGDRWVFNKTRGQGRGGRGFEFIDLKNVLRKNFKFGKVKAEYGRASIEYLDRALELIRDKAIDCLVTCPISKEAVNLAGFSKFSGHTGYLAKSTGIRNVAMMLLNRDLRVSLVTQHIPLKEVARALTKEKIYRTVFITHRYLQFFFQIRNPRLVVCALNPHASDNGLMGREENLVIKPTIKKLRRLIKYIDGPLAADLAVSKAAHKEYDCVIAMYHDQALIPLKLLGSSTGVNLTLGLPFVRTSPLHGTAFDIAGTNVADPVSLIEAIKLAIKCASNLKRA